MLVSIHSTGNYFSLPGGHVDQVPKITDVQVKFSVVITFIEMSKRSCCPQWLGDKENFVFWIF